MKLPEPCATHIPLKGMSIENLVKFDVRANNGGLQRQCPQCLRWYFHGEFGRGWAKGLKQGDHINNILKP